MCELQDLVKAMSCYRHGAKGGDFRGQFCYAGMLATQGKVLEALQWLRRVPETATPARLHAVGGPAVAGFADRGSTCGGNDRCWTVQRGPR
ncbi:MAG: hypothetical protein H7274_17745 [Rhodoferax sp.]|nr:hypothetical protein [Rhodoferax sp.]